MTLFPGLKLPELVAEDALDVAGALLDRFLGHPETSGELGSHSQCTNPERWIQETVLLCEMGLSVISL